MHALLIFPPTTEFRFIKPLYKKAVSALEASAYNNK